MAERHRLTKIYTRTGDAGETGLTTGERISKADLRIAAYGDVDELNSALGIARAINRAAAANREGVAARPALDTTREQTDEWLRDVQNELFLVGSDLSCTLAKRPAPMKIVTDAAIERLEQRIDTMNASLGPLTEFILPGGGLLGAHVHLARTICRRAERAAVALSKREPVDLITLRYLNRLSDFLFVLARHVAKTSGEPEEQWRR